MIKYEIKLPMCLVGVVEAKNEDEAIQIAMDKFDIDNTTCEYWDIVEPAIKKVKG